MTDQEHSAGHDACGADVAAYALGALNPQEAAAFEAHLASCSVCSEELATFQLVVDAMASTAEPRHVPHALKRRVMRTVRQEVRATTERQRRAGLSRFVTAVSMRPLAAATAVLATAAVAFGVVELAAPGSTTYVYPGQVTGQGSAEVKLNGSHAELSVRHFAAPPKGKVYEVWLKRGSKAPVQAHALFNVSSTGDRSVRLPVSLRKGDQVLVTAEPGPNGSSTPTTTPVISVQLS